MPFKAADRAMTAKIMDKARELTNLTVDAAGVELARHFPAFSSETLRHYTCFVRGASGQMVDYYMAGNISLGSARTLCSIPHEKQNAVIDELARRAVTIGEWKAATIKKNLSEGMSVAESVARALGEMSSSRPNPDDTKSLDVLLNEIAGLEAKWRAKVSTAYEAVREVEAAGGVVMPLFERAMLLRELAREQFDYIDRIVRRYVRTLKARMTKGGNHV